MKYKRNSNNDCIRECPPLTEYMKSRRIPELWKSKKLEIQNLYVKKVKKYKKIKNLQLKT